MTRILHWIQISINMQRRLSWTPYPSDVYSMSKRFLIFCYLSPVSWLVKYFPQTVVSIKKKATHWEISPTCLLCKKHFKNNWKISTLSTSSYSEHFYKFIKLQLTWLRTNINFLLNCETWTNRTFDHFDPLFSQRNSYAAGKSASLTICLVS